MSQVQQLELSLHEIQKGAHKHFMPKEILEQVSHPLAMTDMMN